MIAMPKSPTRAAGDVFTWTIHKSFIGADCGRLVVVQVETVLRFPGPQDFDAPHPTAPWPHDLKARKFDVCLANLQKVS